MGEEKAAAECKGKEAPVTSTSGKALASTMNTTDDIQGANATQAWVVLKTQLSFEKKFREKRALRQVPIFGNLTMLGGIVCSCILLAVALGGYAMGARSIDVSRKQRHVSDQTELLEGDSEMQFD